MIDFFLDCAQDALVQFGESLGVEVRTAGIIDVPLDCSGAVIPVTGTNNTFLFGLMGTLEQQRRLACCLFDQDPETGAPTLDDIDDSIGELLNIVAGWIKGNSGNVESVVELGLPLWLFGPPNTRRAIAHKTPFGVLGAGMLRHIAR